MRNEKELVGKRTVTAAEVKEILDSIFEDIPPESKSKIENILKPQFRAWLKIKFPEWTGILLGMSLYATDPTKMEIRTTTGFYDVVDLDKDVPSIVVPLEMRD